MARLKFHNKAFKQILNETVAPEVDRSVDAMGAAAGPDYYVNKNNTDRRRGSVVAGTAKARRKNARDNTLLRALDAGRS